DPQIGRSIHNIVEAKRRTPDNVRIGSRAGAWKRNRRARLCVQRRDDGVCQRVAVIVLTGEVGVIRSVRTRIVVKRRKQPRTGVDKGLAVAGNGWKFQVKRLAGISAPKWVVTENVRDRIISAATFPDDVIPLRVVICIFRKEKHIRINNLRGDNLPVGTLGLRVAHRRLRYQGEEYVAHENVATLSIDPRDNILIARPGSAVYFVEIEDQVDPVVVIRQVDQLEFTADDMRSKGRNHKNPQRNQ